MTKIYNIYFALMMQLHLSVDQIDAMPWYQVEYLYERLENERN